MNTRKPTIDTVDDAATLVHRLRERLVDRNQDLRTLDYTKALHVLSEAKDYDNWQQYRADLVKSECLNTLTRTFQFDAPNAEAAWEALASETVRQALSGRELAEMLAATYALVPTKAPTQMSKEAAMNASILEGFLNDHEALLRGEDPGDLCVYGTGISGIELCLGLGSASHLYLMVQEKDGEFHALNGRIETRGFGASDTLELNEDQLRKFSDLFQIEIKDELASKRGWL